MKTRKLAALIAAALIASTGVIASQTASATEGDPDPIVAPGQGNPTSECAFAGYGDPIKVDTGTPGEYPIDLGDEKSVIVTIHADGSVSFESDVFVNAVIYKAGNNMYIYDYGVPGATEGGPLDPGIQQGLSHVTLCLGDEPETNEFELISVEKTIETSYTREHFWDITKVADVDQVNLSIGEGDNAITWDVDVTYEGWEASLFAVSGTVTVTNVGNIPSTITDITDVLDVDGVPGVIPDTFDCDADLPSVLAPLAEISCDYALAVGDAEVAVSNTATATTKSGIMADDTVDADWTSADVTEINRTMKVSDIGTAYGTDMISDTVTAPAGDSWTLTDNVAYTDFATCGDHSVRNTASLLTVDDFLYEEASDEVAVDVQCLIFQGETAWAANAGPGTLYYARQTGKKGGGNWATYVKALGGVPGLDGSRVYNVYAGQTNLAGTATVSAPSGGTVTVTVDLDGWEYAPGGANMKIQQYASAPTGNPSPGQFEHHTTCNSDPCSSGPIPASNFYGIHLDVGHWVPEPGFPD